MKYFFILAMIFMSGCATVTVSDHEYCGDEGSLGASCFHFLSSATEDIPQPQWDEKRFGQICTDDPEGALGATFADIKATIEKLCSISHDCEYPPVAAQIKAFFARVEAFHAHARQQLQERAAQRAGGS